MGEKLVTVYNAKGLPREVSETKAKKMVAAGFTLKQPIAMPSELEARLNRVQTDNSLELEKKIVALNAELAVAQDDISKLRRELGSAKATIGKLKKRTDGDKDQVQTN